MVDGPGLQSAEKPRVLLPVVRDVLDDEDRAGVLEALVDLLESGLEIPDPAGLATQLLGQGRRTRLLVVGLEGDLIAPPGQVAETLPLVVNPDALGPALDGVVEKVGLELQEAFGIGRLEADDGRVVTLAFEQAILDPTGIVAAKRRDPLPLYRRGPIRPPRPLPAPARDTPPPRAIPARRAGYPQGESNSFSK